MSSDRPALRGYFHQLGFYLSLPAAGFLLWSAEPSALLVSVIYVFGLCGLLATSALYHRVTWSPEWYARMRRLDHTMIYVLIASTFTPFAVLVLEGDLSRNILWALWGAVSFGVLLHLVWPSSPKWLRSIIYVLAGWSGVLTLPELLEKVNESGLLVLYGGVAYTVGAVFYALKRPNLLPGVFGYHELFHVLVLVGAALHYWSVFGVVTGV